MADTGMTEPHSPTLDALPAAPGRRAVPEREIKRDRVKVDRGAGIAKLAVAFVLILAGAGYAVFQSAKTANAPPPKPSILQLDSQRGRG
jgi:hypothetical protein